MSVTFILGVIGILAALVPVITAMLTKVSKQRVIGFYSLMALDILCLKLVFPHLPAIDFQITLIQAFGITAISAVIVGVFGLGLLRFFTVKILSSFSVSKKTALGVAENIYVMSGPFANAVLMMFWTIFIPSLGFHMLWPEALLAGLILHFLDIGVARRWTQLTEK